jgi:hypothetical protein
MAEVVRQALDKNFEVPVCALGALRAGARGQRPASFEYCSEFELLRPDGTPAHELDVCAFVDGKIMIGEAKSSNDLGGSGRSETRELQKLTEVARYLTADIVVLATAGEWRDTTRERINTWASQQAFEVRLLERLLPPIPPLTPPQASTQADDAEC